MKISIYSTAFNILDKGFDLKDALDNWFFYADEVCVAVNKSVDDTEQAFRQYGEEKGYNLTVVPVDIDYEDPFCYGKTEDTALQACTGDLLIQQNLDERLGGKKEVIKNLGQQLLNSNEFASFFVPVINLYEDYDHYSNFAAKWYIHKAGLNRGSVSFGIKENGLPDYHKTSTDELIDENGELLPTYPLCSPREPQAALEYCESGNPFVYHLGFVDLEERAKRNEWWKVFWKMPTWNDDVELKAGTGKKHNLPLWNKKQ